MNYEPKTIWEAIMLLFCMIFGFIYAIITSIKWYEYLTSILLIMLMYECNISPIFLTPIIMFFFKVPIFEPLYTFI